MRCTTQRKAIVTYMLNNKNHPTAKDIYEFLASKNYSSSLANVYANLELLERINLIRTIAYGKFPSRYELTSEPLHSHIVCVQCGSLRDLKTVNIMEETSTSIMNDTGYLLVSLSFELKGLCPDCDQSVQTF
ncbi:Fur family peroxide stress response transcriptional regulator [Alkalihalobacillus xiaoxiensis]|uniref:Fur family peroxide stress response transcriptional regulator n=1 Tax=Shouchella xiaoxiensis TaxID=766895 RepID=A0ABS2SXX3_9BACI|nr:Fur family peroxide stress response transcriptional regulator [Shouchella xiaoxiensis]